MMTKTEKANLLKAVRAQIVECAGSSDHQRLKNLTDAHKEISSWVAKSDFVDSPATAKCW